jgi:hypothetical protein
MKQGWILYEQKEKNPPKKYLERIFVLLQYCTYNIENRRGNIFIKVAHSFLLSSYLGSTTLPFLADTATMPPFPFLFIFLLSVIRTPRLFLYIFWLARVCRPLLRLCLPFMIFEGCLDSNPEWCRNKLARYRLSHPSLDLLSRGARLESKKHAILLKDRHPTYSIRSVNKQFSIKRSRIRPNSTFDSYVSHATVPLYIFTSFFFRYQLPTVYFPLVI